LTFIFDFDDPQLEKKIMRFARAHRSIEMFNEQISKRAITCHENEYYLDKETYGKLTGVKIKIIRQRKKIT
jgi:hypothetical protein